MDYHKEFKTENELRVAEEYLSSLADLTCNSKPLINMLTMLAEENIDYASVIVRVVQDHISKVPPDVKLPILYLIDSIIKNVKSAYIQLFSQYIITIFCGVFETVHEKIRERMYALRQTWNEVFSPQKLLALDIKVKQLDANWPITAKQPSTAKPAIHVNPNFLKSVGVTQSTLPSEMEEILQAKTRELLELKKRKLELELEQTKKHLEEQEKQLIVTDPTVAVGAVPTTTAFPVPNSMHVSATPHNVPMHNTATAFNQNFHNMRSLPQQPAIAQAMQQQQVHMQKQMTPPHASMLPMPPQAFMQSNSAAAMSKTKVNAVNPAMMDTLRLRDPRIARSRQQESQKASATHSQASMHNRNDNSNRNNGNKSGNVQQRNSHNNGNRSKTRSRSKSPPMSRHSNSSSSNRNRSSKSSSSDRDKERKRNESSKSSSSSSSSPGAHRSERHKGNSYLRDNKSDHIDTINTVPMTTTPKIDINVFDIESATAANKRKSSSPFASPSPKSKRAAKHRNRGKSSTRSRSRSRSPRATKTSESAKDFKDIDMRSVMAKPLTDALKSQNQKRLDDDLLSSPKRIAPATTTIGSAGNNNMIDLEKRKKCQYLIIILIQLALVQKQQQQKLFRIFSITVDNYYQSSQPRSSSESYSILVVLGLGEIS